MPSDVSNAVGTARQFTPQPDAAYQGRYSGVQVGQASSSIDTFSELTDNMSKLEAAFQGYAVAREKRMDEMNLDAATRMVNSESAEDVERLNVIDAAQKYGYVDSMNNPYFKAYVSKLRGTFLATKMKQDYDAEFAMKPPKNVDELQERYNNFSSKWKEKLFDSVGDPDNMTAFETGFNESNLLNVTSLSNDFYKKKREDDIAVLMASTQSKLGDIIKNSVELLKSNGSMTKAAQDAFNDTRLMGLPSAYRLKLLDDWTQELIKTGHIDAPRLEQMLDSLTITTDMDGSQVKASSLLDIQSLRSQATDYNRQFITQKKIDWVKKWVDAEDYKGAVAEVESMRQNDPDNAPTFNSMLPMIDSQIEAKKQKREAERKAAAREAAKGAKRDGANDMLRGALKAWITGHDTYNGMVAAAISNVPDDIKNGVFLESLQYALDQNNEPDMSPEMRANYVESIMSFPAFSHLRSGMIAQYTAAVHKIVPNGDGSVYQSGYAKSLVAIRKAAPMLFADSWGAELDGLIGAISYLSDTHGGNIDEGIADFAKYNSLDKVSKDSYTNQADSMLAGYTLAGIHTLGGGDSAMAPNISINPQMVEAAKIQAAVFMANGYSAYDAVNMAGSLMRDNYIYYHGSLFPKGVLNNIGTPDDEAYLQKALDRYIYNVAGNGNAEDVNIRYDSNSQMFYLSGNGNSFNVSLYTLRNGAYDIYAEEANASKESPNNYDASVEDVNSQRSEYNYANYSETDSFVSGLTGSPTN